MVIEMPVYIGTVALENVLGWEEEESMTIPVKRVIRKTSPTTQAQYFVREPRRITITARLTRAEKNSLRSLKNEANWQFLCDHNCVPPCSDVNSEFVDYVWIEKLDTRWSPEFKGSTPSYDTPWVYTIMLICSQT